MAERNNGQAPRTDTEIVHEDWDRRDVSDQSYSRVAFLDVDMTELTDDAGVFEECTFRDVSFNASVHTHAAFTNCTFTHCSFFDASFEGCKLLGSRFSRCSFRILKASGGDWSFVGLPGAKLAGSTLMGVRMREADLTGADREDATLTDWTSPVPGCHGPGSCEPTSRLRPVRARPARL
jgi:fluoroquinolone resistance protein